MRILLVDDEKDLLEVIRDALITYDLFRDEEIVTATNGQDALAIYKEVSPGILITDMSMPKMSGDELISKIREFDEQVEIIVMTGFGDMDMAVRLLQYRVTAFLRKPANIADIAAAAARVRERIILRRENEAYREKMQQLEKLSSIGLLASGVAHEINNPNTFVKGSVQILSDYLKVLKPYLKELAEKPENAGTDLKMIYENIDRPIEMAMNGTERIRKTVDAFRVIARHGLLEKSDISSAKLIDEALTLTRHRWLRHECVVEVPPEARLVHVNEQEIFQVLMNLIVNAADAMNEKYGEVGQGRLTLRVQDVAGSPFQVIELRDTGPGIAPSVLTKLFQPFITTKPVGRGTGLGLSISRANAERNGGRLTCESQLGEGTTFRIELPVINKNAHL